MVSLPPKAKILSANSVPMIKSPLRVGKELISTLEIGLEFLPIGKLNSNGRNKV